MDLRSHFDQLDLKGGNWDKDSNNEFGYLAFREAYVLQAYLLMYETYQDTFYLEKFIIHADSVLNQRDHVRGVTDYRGLSLPAWRHTDPPGETNPLILGGKFFHVAIDTGSIAYPYAWFAQIVKSDPALSVYGDKAAVYAQAAKDAVGVHEDEWRESGAEGCYIYRKGSPYWCDGVGVPFNQNLSLARAMLKIYQATGDTRYIDRVVKIALHFKNNLTLDTDRYVWNYWWGHGYDGWVESQQVSVNTPSYKGYKKIEDFRHGGIDVDFAIMAYQAGLVYSAEDMRFFANTLEKNLIQYDGQVNEFVNGQSPDGSSGAHNILIGMWLRYHQLAPTLPAFTYEKVRNLNTASAPALLVVAYLNWAGREGEIESVHVPAPVVVY